MNGRGPLKGGPTSRSAETSEDDSTTDVRQSPDREGYALVAESVTASLRCGDCHRLYGYLDRRQCNRTWAVKGAGEIADHLGWQPRTAKKHLRHLADVGIIQLDPEPSPAWGNTLVRVVHQPTRGRYAEVRTLPDVWEPEAPRRWRKPPKSREELDALQSNGWRDAPPPDDRTGSAPRPPGEAHRATTGGATRPLCQSNGERDAPTVPVYEVIGGISVPDSSELSSVALLESYCASCGAPADGQPDPDGPLRCRAHEPF